VSWVFPLQYLACLPVTVIDHEAAFAKGMARVS